MQGYVAIYGGSFDPPHKGHSEIIRTLCENVLYTHIILMPNFK
ncbi:adenylyltransferase/cytidyltransferase family protein, partial [Helicobacter typhlonius]